MKLRMDLLLLDRKSTRLNSSHVKISYAVFPTTFYTLSLHDALPICLVSLGQIHPDTGMTSECDELFFAEVESYSDAEAFEGIIEILPTSVLELERLIRENEITDGFTIARSEEHTSELQSRENLVCRLPHHVLHSFPTRRSSDLSGFARSDPSRYRYDFGM